MKPTTETQLLLTNRATHLCNTVKLAIQACCQIEAGSPTQYKLGVHLVPSYRPPQSLAADDLGLDMCADETDDSEDEKYEVFVDNDDDSE